MSEQFISDKKDFINLDDYSEDGIFELKFDSQSLGPSAVRKESLLLVVHQGQYHVIENKCGHFGVPLLNGELSGNEIICTEHGISFDLDSGNIVNRPYENCDPIKTFDSIVIGNRLYLKD
ncbi:MAG: Rieske 2Fe-2S domain-containing protein [Gammaproteobacteria bacterium]|nr:Rieske 2Fe-2S domain-containing protein [Gammaproteobacteria bacterium]